MPGLLEDRTERPLTAEPACSAGLARAREAVAEACGPCPERDGTLRRQLACRCPVALAVRLLQLVERRGAEPSALTAQERASLDFQERALARKLPPLDAAAVERALALLERGHAGCAGDGCLACRVEATLRRLAERAAEVARG